MGPYVANGWDVAIAIAQWERTLTATTRQLNEFKLHVYGYFQIVNMLLTLDVNVNHFGEKMWAPVHVACHHGYKSIVTSLIRDGADFETPVEGGVTALYIAAYAGHAKIVRLLIKHGAEVCCLGLTLLKYKQMVKHTDPIQ